ncbi:CAP family protein [Allokutzneria albata]|uniref:Cysteine-rich secretory protein family protein n=1 Tax=Allokutzneria albata TaxID=211114 RepID=A0A1G9SN99_ALLAB|nr:CAP family protein [Allokutzneria albata]SDM36285.1 Cysteine-rich secretory protein family protein [Allokutzneria albata]
MKKLIAFGAVAALVLGVATTGTAQAATPQDYTTDAFQRDCLAAHNAYRKRHGAPVLKTDPKIVAFAKGRGTRLAATEILAHDAANYGENLNWSWSSAGPAPVPCASVVKGWYDQIKNYDWKNPDSSWKQSGFFTQVVWKSTTTVGCAQVAALNGKKGGTYTVCNYAPAGNLMGSFADNVSRPRG